MSENRRESRLVGEVAAGPCRYAWEEYWEEDDAGFCCVDYVLEKHTRLVALDAATGARLREYPYDSREYEKALTYDGKHLKAMFHPSWNRKTLAVLNPETGEILSEETLPEEKEVP